MRTLLLIPSRLKTGIASDIRDDRHPRPDYEALADALRAAGNSVELLGYAEVEAERDTAVRLAGRSGGSDVALALMGFQRRRDFDVIFTNGENVAIPLSLMLRGQRSRPGHVTIGHRPSTGKKRVFFKNLRVHRDIDTMFLYSPTQLSIATGELGIPDENLRLFHFHADDRFFRPLPEVAEEEGMVCAAGLEWRDYPTLIRAFAERPETTLKIAAASPWSKHRNETERVPLPANVSARRYNYAELRDLYARASIVAVPLYENDFQAGITTMLEAMAMGKAVIVTQTTGQQGVITNGVNGLTVAPGDVDGWKRQLNLLLTNPGLRESLGREAQQWVAGQATLDRWVRDIVVAMQDAAESRAAYRSASRDTTATPAV